MYSQLTYTRAVIIILLALLWASVAPNAALQAAPLTGPAMQAGNTTELVPTDDARTQTGSPDTNFGSGHLWVGHPEVHYSLIKFDLSVLPANAQIDSAELQLYFTGIYTGSNQVEVGRIDGAWDEATLIGSTPVSFTWSSQFQTVTSTGKDDSSTVAWDVTQLAQAWHSGARVNDGVALRGSGGELKAAHSKETGAARNENPYRGPKLIITYTLPPEEDPRRPDLGDAPDSTNHHGQPNTAYAGAGILGQFPTVWEVPANQAAGPLHENATGEGILGQFISREREADAGPDQDGPNNIIRNAATGAIGDVADNDRGDDGWRNRGIPFPDCRKQTLTVRISKAPNAQLEKMYLNVWFDGNRDGDWDDFARCVNPTGGPDEAAFEWIVQDRAIDMTAIPAGGFLDININTERVLNSTEELPHWMRFTLSEARAVQPQSPNKYPDGRGPHPSSPQKSFRFGETEDVLQKPPAPGEPGELVLEKRVITNENPVDYPGEVTYQIRLSHVGGTAPVDAHIRDLIGFPQHLLPRLTNAGDIVYIEVRSASGGASPLEANLSYVDGGLANALEQLVSWDGTLEPDSEVLLSFDVHVHPFCPAFLNTKTITNIARARAVGSNEITAEASYEAKCPGYDADGGIELEPHENPIDPDDLSTVPWNGTVWNKHPISVTLGFFQELTNPGTPTPTVEIRPLGTVTLDPDERQEVELGLVVTDQEREDLGSDREATVGRIFFCILNGEDNKCPNAAEYPNMEAEVPPPVWIPQPEELGDAPDSTNHFAGVAMTAYVGVQANFPTVFDPALGADQGPKHHNPQPLHLGPLVSNEAEADGGPDADGVNNIWPPANANDLDWFDDGAQLSNLANCQPARVDVRVAANAAAVNWFDNNDRVAYLNVWLDSNRDGDWADGFTCVDEAGQNKDVVEHILIDYEIDVAALGAGLSNLPNIATDRVAWPAQGLQAPRWIRFTLSERPSNKPLTYNGIQYGDGRGHAQPFRTGETEDYLRVLQSAGGGGGGGAPDLALRMGGQIVPSAAAINDGTELRLKFDYTNRGNQNATGGVLTLDNRGIIRNAEMRAIQGPGISADDVSKNNGKLNVALPNLAPGQSATIMMRFGPLAEEAITAASIRTVYTLTARIDLAGDINPGNNTASTAVSTPMAALRLAASVESDDLLRKADTTCRDEVWFQGRAEPLTDVSVYVNVSSNITVQADAAGLIKDLRLTNLPEGPNLVWLHYASHALISPRDAASGQAVRLAIDTSLPVDPITLLLTDSQGRQFHPPTLGLARGAAQIDNWPLQDGETYTISIRTCMDDPNLAARLFINNDLLGSLRDEDGDSVYTGSFTYNATAQAAAVGASHATNQLRLVVETGGVEQSFNAAVSTLAQSVVSDATSSLPVAGANVTALVANGDAGFSAITATESSQPAAQTTGADGSYGFSVADGVYRLDVTANGYQPYRTDDILVQNGNLAANIKLTPTVAEPADHTIYITANGFVPATLTAKPGEIVGWVNADLMEHATTAADQWDSGLLDAGTSYKVLLAERGEFTYSDGASSLAQGTILVDDTPDNTGGTNRVFMPVVLR